MRKAYLINDDENFFELLRFAPNSLTRIKRFAPLHSLTHIFCYEKTLEVTSFYSSPSGRLTKCQP